MPAITKQYYEPQPTYLQTKIQIEEVDHNPLAKKNIQNFAIVQKYEKISHHKPQNPHIFWKVNENWVNIRNSLVNEAAAEPTN